MRRKRSTENKNDKQKAPEIYHRQGGWGREEDYGYYGCYLNLENLLVFIMKV